MIHILFILALLIPSTFDATQAGPGKQSTRNQHYIGASVTPFYWDKDGTTWFLLGKEYRHDKRDKSKSGDFWFNFGGNRDAKDNQNPLITAKREGNEESAQTLTFIPSEFDSMPVYVIYRPFSITKTEPNSRHHVTYFLRVKEMVDPAVIQSTANIYKRQGLPVEKDVWKWVRADDLLMWAQNAKEHDIFKGLDKPIFGIYLKELQNYSVVQPIIVKIIEQGIAHKKKPSEGERKTSKAPSFAEASAGKPQEGERKISRAPAQGIWTSQHEAVVNTLNQFANHMIVGQTDLALADIEKATSLIRGIKPADVAAQNKNGSTLFDIAANVSQTVGQLPSSVRGKWDSLVNKLIG